MLLPARIRVFSAACSASLLSKSVEYHCVVKAPSSQKDYLAVVNEAMALRAKQLQAEKKQ